jgi:hypothetical protein
VVAGVGVLVVVRAVAVDRVTAASLEWLTFEVPPQALSATPATATATATGIRIGIASSGIDDRAPVRISVTVERRWTQRD